MQPFFFPVIGKGLGVLEADLASGVLIGESPARRESFKSSPVFIIRLIPPKQPDNRAILPSLPPTTRCHQVFKV